MANQMTTLYDCPPSVAANQAPIFVYGCIRGSTTKKMSSPCPYSERAPANEAGTPTKRTWVLCDFTSENKEEKTNRHLNPNCRPFFAVCIRGVLSKKMKDFFGVYRYFAGVDSEYWHGALKKTFLVGVWCVFFSLHHSPALAPWFAELMVVYLVYAGHWPPGLGLWHSACWLREEAAGSW